MTLEKALQRLSWRFSTPKAFTPNENDVDALNKLIRTVNDLKDSKFETNQGFAKLFIFAYAYFVKHYDTDILDDIPQKELSKLLSKDISVLIRRFTDNLNESGKYKSLESLLGESKHPALLSDEDKELRYEKIKSEVDKNPDMINSITEDAWKYEDVEDSLKSMIGTALIRFKL